MQRWIDGGEGASLQLIISEPCSLAARVTVPECAQFVYRLVAWPICILSTSWPAYLWDADLKSKLRNSDKSQEISAWDHCILFICGGHTLCIT